MSSPAAPRIFVVEGTRGDFEVFEVVENASTSEGVIMRVRSPYLFEIGETLAIRVEHATTTWSARVRVRAHTGPRDARVTELEILERSSHDVATGAVVTG